MVIIMLDELDIPKTAVIFITVLIIVLISLILYLSYNSSGLQNLLKIFGLAKAVV